MGISVFEPQEHTLKWLYKIGGISALLLIFYSIITMIIVIVLGATPKTAEETFNLLQKNKVNGMLRLDLLTFIFMPLYYLLFAAILAALWRTKHIFASLATGIIVIGLTLFLTTPSVFSMVYLSDQYASASTEAQKALFLAAGEAIISSDMWHSTAAIIGGILMQGGAVLISALMLHGNIFSKLTAYIGILTFGLDLVHILIGFFLPGVSVILMAIAGILYLLWFPLVGWRLLQMSK